MKPTQRRARRKNKGAVKVASHDYDREAIPGTDITIWEMVINRAGGKIYSYYMASWPGLSRDAYIGSTRRINKDEAVERAKSMRSNRDSIKRAIRL